MEFFMTSRQLEFPASICELPAKVLNDYDGCFLYFTYKYLEILYAVMNLSPQLTISHGPVNNDDCASIT